MLKIAFAWLCVLSLAASPCLAADAPGAAGLPAVGSFFAHPAYSAAKLSPDGTLLAVRVNRANRDALAVIDLLDNSRNKVVAHFADADVGNFEWVNDKRLIFDSTNRQLAQGDIEYAPGLFAVDRDGGQLLQLSSRTRYIRQGRNETRFLPAHSAMMGQAGAQNSDSVYVVTQAFDHAFRPDGLDLYRVDTRSGRATLVPANGIVQRWMLDAKGEPRLAMTRDKNVNTIHYIEPGTAVWRKLVDYDAYQGGADAFVPLSFGPDGTLYVSANAGNDKKGVYRYDLVNARIDPVPLVRVEDFDFAGRLIATGDKLLGMQLVTDGESSEWFDPAMKALQARIDARLPDTINLLTPAARASTPWMLVSSYSDRQPPLFRVFNQETGDIKLVGASYPAIDAARMASQRVVHYKARDGLVIPALLTVPAGAAEKALPLVVLVHGGPYVRGHLWGWNPDSQFLASRGYAVLEPEYRGSTGHGKAHFRAGWKQWGLAMQNDIADGAKWAIAQGIVDARRICIAGASYGGYATLMGLVNDPDLYKCGVEWSGVTDIKLMSTGTWYADSDISDVYKQYGMPALVGDLVKDAAQLDATSPLIQAARIKQPLLLAYGGADRRVPIYHGKKFYDAVKPGNPNVEWVEYPEEGHGWHLLATRLDFWSRVEKFLDKQIGKP